MQRSFWALLFVSINALSDAGSKPSGDVAYPIMQRGPENLSLDQSVAEPINHLDPIAPSESLIYAPSHGDLFASAPFEADGSETPSSTTDTVPDSELSSSASLMPTFETAFVADKDSESGTPSCTSPTMAACCVQNSMFTSCVWWGLDRIFCEDSSNYACCESIQDYIGTNCEHVGEEGKDWDWLGDILRTPINLEPLVNPLENLPPIPWFPERV